jgi:Chaperone of endosialidase
MKKIILFAIFLICACVVKAQNPTGVPQLFGGKWYKFNQFVGIDSALLVGSKDTNWLPRQPSLVFWQHASVDTAFWVYDGRKWNKMGNFLDTSSLSNRINLRVKYSDTASMLSPYLRKLDTISLSNRINLKADKATTLTINGVTYDLSANRTWTIPTVDTTSLSNRINLKLNISDTASMLSPYQIAINARVKYTDTASMLAPYLRKADTISLSNRINTKLNISDTASMLSVYLRKADTSSLSNRINLKADKATTLTINGTTYDLSANRSWTIPTIDTTSLSNRINLKLNISDTASMLSPYQIAINARVKYTDTASMLSPYLRKLDTASLSNRINLKQNILSLTTTGTSGAATLVGATLNIPQYQGVLTNPITGTGTINTVAKFTSSSAIGNSNIKDDGSAVSVNTTAGSFGALQVGSYNGNILMNTNNTNGGLIFQNTSSSNKLWDISSYNNDLNFNESNISPSVMTLKAGGNVLISNLSGSGTRMVVASSTGVLSTQSISTTDTTSLSNRINTKLNISDTAAMLSPYLKSAVTSVGLSMPSAFTVSNSPVTSTGTLTVAGAGNSTQYIRGDGVLATYNPGSGGGGSSQVFYFNGGVASGVGGYQEMSKVANTGASANYSINANGYIASFLTGTGVPNQVSIPAGNWNFEIYMSASSGGGSPSFYVELYKYDGTTFTLISSSSANPEYITNGTSVDLYVTALSVPATTLLSTDRLAVRVYVTHASKTITMYTQNGNLSEVITTFTTGLGSLNGLIANTQYLSTGTTGSDFNISSITDTHTFNLPTASSTKRGALSSADWSTFNGKMNYSDTASLSNRINTKLNISDTASMLSNYQSGINARLKISDTASMLSVYLRKADTSSLSNRINTKQGTITLTTTGTSGAATFSSNTLNIPQYQAAGTYVTAVTGTSPIVSSGGTTPAISIPAATSSVNGYLSSTDWSTFNNKGSGSVTSVATGLGLSGGTITTSGTLLVDTASASILSRQRAANTYYLASNPNGYNTGTVTSVATGLGLSGGTISTSGTLLVDTSSASILSRQRAANTYATTSSLSGYLPLTGGTLTGALGGTSATFSGNLTFANSGTATANILASSSSGTLQFTAGSTSGYTGGGTIELVSNDRSGVNTRGEVYISAGNATNNSANGFISLLTNNIERLRIASTGAATFSSSVTAAGNITVNGSGVQSLIAQSSGSDALVRLNNTTTTTGKNFYITSTSAGNLQIVGTNNIATFFDSGNVGIGTTSPQAKFHTMLSDAGTTPSLTNTILVGNDNTTVGNFSGIYFSQTNGDGGAVVGAVHTGRTAGSRNSDLAFYTMASSTVSERMRITSGGNVLVGGTYNTARLTAIGEDNSSSTRAFAVRNLGLDNMFNIRNDGLINSGLAAYSPYNNSTTGRTMVIQSDGSLGYLVSTRESKANIDSIKSIDFINKLNPVQFNYRKKNDLSNTYSNEIYEKITYGFIADEVEKVNKELVFYNSDGTTLAGVEYNSMIAILTKAVQELSAKNEALIKRIETLENK